MQTDTRSSVAALEAKAMAGEKVTPQEFADARSHEAAVNHLAGIEQQRLQAIALEESRADAQRKLGELIPEIERLEADETVHALTQELGELGARFYRHFHDFNKAVALMTDKVREIKGEALEPDSVKASFDGKGVMIQSISASYLHNWEDALKQALEYALQRGRQEEHNDSERRNGRV